MAKKWNKLIARIEALEDALARMLRGGRKSKKNKKKKKAKAKTRRAQPSKSKPAKSKAAPSKSTQSKAAKSKPARRPAKATVKPRRARKPRPAAAMASPPEIPLITL